MSETMKIVLMVLITIGAFILTLRVAGWKMKPLNKKPSYFVRKSDPFVFNRVNAPFWFGEVPLTDVS